jgi:uncharacterized protein (TIGR03437 family)
MKHIAILLTFISVALAQAPIGGPVITRILPSPCPLMNNFPTGYLHDEIFRCERRTYSLSLSSLSPTGLDYWNTFLPPRPAVGSLFTVYGSGLASATASVAYGGDWLAQLGGVTLTIDGVPCPLGYVSPAQINALVPSQIQTDPMKQHQLVLQTAQGQTNTTIGIDPYYGTLFGWGDNHYAAALDSHYQLITPANPAVSGQTIALFGTGLGATSQVNGIEYAKATPILRVVQPTEQADTRLNPFAHPCASIPVTFAGRAPGFPGLDQINIQVPVVHVDCDPAQPELDNALIPISISVYIPNGPANSNAVMLPIKLPSTGPPALSPPSTAPTGLAPTGLVSATPTLQWLPVPSATGYTVTLTDSQGNAVILGQSVAAPPLKTPTLQKGKNYCFNVTAYNSAGLSPQASQCFAVWPGYSGTWISTSGIQVGLGLAESQEGCCYHSVGLVGGFSGVTCNGDTSPKSGSLLGGGLDRNDPDAPVAATMYSWNPGYGGWTQPPLPPGTIDLKLLMDPVLDSQGFAIAATLTVTPASLSCTGYSSKFTLRRVQ